MNLTDLGERVKYELFLRSIENGKPGEVKQALKHLSLLREGKGKARGTLHDLHDRLFSRVMSITPDHAEILKLLLETGLDPDDEDAEGNFLSLKLCYEPQATPMLERLLSAGANPDKSLANSDSPLLIATRVLNLSAARVLLNHGANVDVKNHKGQTPLAILLERIIFDKTTILKICQELSRMYLSRGANKVVVTGGSKSVEFFEELLAHGLLDQYREINL